MADKSITKVKARGEDRYRLRVYMGIDPRTGKQQWVRDTFKTRKEAQKAKNELLGRKGSGDRIAPGRQPFKEYLEDWLEMRRRTGIKRGKHAGKPLAPATLEGYGNLLRRFIFDPPKDAPALGQIAIAKLQAEDFGAFYRYFEDLGTGPTVLRYLHALLRQALRDAQAEDRIISRNPTDSRRAQPQAPAAPENGSPVRAMTKEQVDAFLTSAREDRFWPFWFLLLTSGMRPGEAKALRWRDVDLETGRVTVQHSLTTAGVVGWQLKAPKTERSRRTIPLPEETTQALRSHRAKQGRERLLLGEEYRDQDFVFATMAGEPLANVCLHGNFRRICKRIGMGTQGERPPKPARGPRGKAMFKPSFRVYDLRHTHATFLLREGVPAKVVSERLGHSTITLTMDTYSHVLPDMQDRAVEAMKVMLG